MKDKNKKAILFGVISFVFIGASIGAYFFITDLLHKPQHSPPIRFQVKDQQEQIALTYHVNSTILNINEKNGTSNNEFTQTQSKATIIPIHNRENKTFTVVLKYHEFVIIEENQYEDGEQDDSQSNSQSTQDGEIVYIAEITEDTGKILSLLKKVTINSKLIDQLTLMTLQQIFPDEQRLNSSIGSQINNSTLGMIRNHFELEDYDEDNVLISSFNDQRDIQDYSQYQGLQFDTNSKQKLKTDRNNLIVKEGEEKFYFKFDSEKQQRRVLDGEQDEEDELDLDLFGNTGIDIDINFLLVNIEFNDEHKELHSQIIQDIIQNGDNYDDIDIEDQSFTFEVAEDDDIPDDEEYIGPGNHTNRVLQSRQQSWDHTYTVFSKKILKQEVKLIAVFNSNGQYISAQADIYVNSKHIKTIYKWSVDFCETGSYSKDHEWAKRLFKIKWPILGILNLDIDVEAIVKYGFKVTDKQGCSVSFVPYLKPGLRGSGSMNLWLVKGGFYIDGTLANVYLILSADVYPVPSVPLRLSGLVDIKAFEVEIGVFGQKKKCRFKRWKIRCSWGSKKKWKIFEWASSSLLQKELFKWDIQ